MQVVNASRNCVFAAAALLEQLGDTLAFGHQPYAAKMAADVLPAFDPNIVARYVDGRDSTSPRSVWG